MTVQKFIFNEEANLDSYFTMISEELIRDLTSDEAQKPIINITFDCYNDTLSFSSYQPSRKLERILEAKISKLTMVAALEKFFTEIYTPD